MIRIAPYVTVVIALADPFSPTPARATAQPPVTLTEQRVSYSLAGHLDYMEDAQRTLSIDDVRSTVRSKRFAPHRSGVPNFGFTRSAVWLRFAVDNPTRIMQELLLECSYPLLDRIAFYLVQPDGTVLERVVGDLFPHGNRIIRGHNNFLLPMTVGAGQRLEVYLRVETQGSMQVPLTLWTQRGFMDRVSSVQLIFGAYYGLMLVMIVYILFLYLSVRSRSYLYYLLFICSGVVYQSSAEGMAQVYLWPEQPWLADRIFLLSMYAIGLTIPLFAKFFLRLKELMPGWNRLMSACIALSALGAILSFVTPYRFGVSLVAVSNPLVGITVLIVGFVSLRSGFKPARYFVPAMSAYILGALLWAINKQGLIPRTFLTDASHEIGLALSVILFAFALADRINIMQRDRWQAQVQLRTAYKRLDGHDRLRTQFFSTVSAKLRTPLDLLQKPLEGLLKQDGETLPAAIRAKLRSIADNIQRLLRLVNQLFDFSLLTSGVIINYEAVNLPSFIQPIVKAFHPLAQSRGLSLVLREETDRPGTVYLDPDKLDKVLSNLLSNACKFTDKGGIVVRLFGTEASVGISVADSGIGIPQQDLGRIFDRFYQSHREPSQRYQGTGIGLALSKELIELMGGTLEVESELDVGTTFTITLPRDKAHIRHPSQIGHGLFMEPGFTHSEGAASALWAEIGHPRPKPTDESEADEKTADPKQPSKPLVLIVEDNRDMRALVAEICREAFRIMEAEDGQQALEKIEKRRPALVISDILMPRLNGEQLVERIRSNPDLASIPVMLLTAKADQETRLGNLETGADDYLSKPFDSRELLARAKNLVRLQQHEQELEALHARLQRDIVRQSSSLTRARLLGRYLPPALVHTILEEGQSVELTQHRRRLTVFQIEIRGFDDLIDAVEPEEMTALLNGYLTAMVEVGFSYGATIDKFIRDTIVGFFGAPISQGPKQDAVRCARMALEMWTQATALCRCWQELYKGELVRPTAILSSGHATVGNFGSDSRMEYTAVGGCMDEASMLLPRVTAGDVICCQGTWSLIKDEIEGHRCAEQIDSGRSRPVDLYRLARLEDPDAVQERERPEEIPSPSTPTTVRRERHDPHRLEPGLVIANRYTIARLLGEGGMSVVYMVHDRRLDTTVAMKLVPTTSKPRSAKWRSLHREVKLARLISHPNVGRIYDLDEWEGHDFIIMEYIEGRTLANALQAQGPFPLEEGQQVLIQLCTGLAAAHTLGIVHRDLNASNVMQARDGRVVILDFGLAGWASGMPQADSESGKVLGTPHYMAPEQFKGIRASLQSDIYALGVIAFEIFTGHTPFEADTPVGLAYKHVYERPPDPQTRRLDLPPLLSAIILQCLEKNPTDRFNSVGEIRSLLGDMVESTT